MYPHRLHNTNYLSYLIRKSNEEVVTIQDMEIPERGELDSITSFQNGEFHFVRRKTDNNKNNKIRKNGQGHSWKQNGSETKIKQAGTEKVIGFKRTLTLQDKNKDYKLWEFTLADHNGDERKDLILRQFLRDSHDNDQKKTYPDPDNNIIYSTPEDYHNNRKPSQSANQIYLHSLSQTASKLDNLPNLPQVLHPSHNPFSNSHSMGSSHHHHNQFIYHTTQPSSLQHHHSHLHHGHHPASSSPLSHFDYSNSPTSSTTNNYSSNNFHPLGNLHLQIRNESAQNLSPSSSSSSTPTSIPPNYAAFNNSSSTAANGAPGGFQSTINRNQSNSFHSFVSDPTSITAQYHQHLTHSLNNFSAQGSGSYDHTMAYPNQAPYASHQLPLHSKPFPPQFLSLSREEIAHHSNPLNFRNVNILNTSTGNATGSSGTNNNTNSNTSSFNQLPHSFQQNNSSPIGNLTSTSSIHGGSSNNMILFNQGINSPSDISHQANNLQLPRINSNSPSPHPLFPNPPHLYSNSSTSSSSSQVSDHKRKVKRAKDEPEQYSVSPSSTSSATASFDNGTSSASSIYHLTPPMISSNQQHLNHMLGSSSNTPTPVSPSGNLHLKKPPSPPSPPFFPKSSMMSTNNHHHHHHHSTTTTTTTSSSSTTTGNTPTKRKEYD